MSYKPTHDEIREEAKVFIQANVWDGEDRSGATNDAATFNPDEINDLVTELLDHLIDRNMI